MLKLTLVAFLSLSELFEECLVMGDKLPIEFHSDVLRSCNLGDDAVFRIVKLHGYCSSLIKILSSGTKGCGLVCCFLSANYLAFYLHVVFFFCTSSSLISGVYFSASSSLVWHSVPFKSRNAGGSPVVLCGMVR